MDPTASAEASAEASAPATETTGSARSALIIDGSYAVIGARNLGGKIDYIKLRAALEELASAQFGDCWFFDQNPSAQRINSALAAEYHRLKFAPPDGPQFQVSLFPMKKYDCHCRRCGNRFSQNVQKGVDNGIATKILSLAYENICDRFVLFAGDGDFYSSLSHVRNVLRKDIWVIGYRGTVSGDLQQLASRVIWINNLWSQVKSAQYVSSYEHSRRDERQKYNESMDEVRWFEDHQGDNYRLDNDSRSSLDEDQDLSSGRHVVIAPRYNPSIRRRGRSRDGRFTGRGRGRNGQGRSRSRSRDRPRAEQPSSEGGGALVAVSDVNATTTSVQAGMTNRKRRLIAEEKRGTGIKNGKKRKRIDKNERKWTRRGGRWGKQEDDLPLCTLSDVSSDENDGGPSSSATAASVVTAQGRDYEVDEIIDLASDTDSE